MKLHTKTIAAQYEPAPRTLSFLLCGIPCRLRDPRSRRVVASVLRQIRERFPKDFTRLLSRVRMIDRLSKREFAQGTRGEWLGRTFSQDYCAKGLDTENLFFS